MPYFGNIVVLKMKPLLGHFGTCFVGSGIMSWGLWGIVEIKCEACRAFCRFFSASLINLVVISFSGSPLGLFKLKLGDSSVD